MASCGITCTREVMPVVYGRPLRIQYNVRYVRYDISELHLPLRYYYVNKSPLYQLSFNRDLTPSALGSVFIIVRPTCGGQLYFVVAAGFSEDSGSGDAEGTRWRRVTRSSTGTGCSLGSRGLWSSNGIGTGTRGFFGESWRKGGVSAV